MNCRFDTPTFHQSPKCLATTKSKAMWRLPLALAIPLAVSVAFLTGCPFAQPPAPPMNETDEEAGQANLGDNDELAIAVDGQGRVEQEFFAHLLRFFRENVKCAGNKFNLSI